MDPQQASDEVTDLIASIEMHRQEVERESGLDASRNYALPKLQELLRSEQEASQQPGAETQGSASSANIEAVNAAIRKLQSLNRGGQQRRQGKQQGQFRGPRQGGGQPGQPGEQRHGQRHRGRRQQARGRGGR